MRKIWIAVIAILIILCGWQTYKIFQMEKANTGKSGQGEELIFVVADQISPKAHEEAVKAQCVIARTALSYAKKYGGAAPESITEDELKEIWGDDFERNRKFFTECIAATDEEVLTWQGDLIYAPYHRISAGETRSLAENYPETDMPYIVSVSCPDDIGAEGYIDISYLDEKDFFQIYKLDDGAKPNIEGRDTAGYVTSVIVGAETMTGEEFRNALGLPSACFNIVETKEGDAIVIKGMGHGYGLSQNEANAMADRGSDYRTILAYFYPNTELKIK